MTTEPLATPAMRERIARLRRLDAAPATPGRRDPDRLTASRPAPRHARHARRIRRVRPQAGEARVSGPLLLAVESSCDETGDRAGRGRAPDPRERRREPGGAPRPDRRHRAGGRRPSAPALGRAGARRGLRHRRRRLADVDAVAVTYGPGLAGSLLVGINFAKAIAWAHRKPLVARQPPGGPRVRRLAPGSGRGRARPAGVPARGAHRLGRAHVPRRDARPPRLPAARQTIDDAAGEAFDKVGRLLGLGYPGGPAISRAAEAAAARRTRSSRGRGCATPTTSASGASRRRRGGSSRGPGPTTACRPTSGRARCPTRSIAELAWGFQDSVMDVLVTKTIRAAEEVGAHGDRPRWRGRGQRRAPGPDRRRGGGPRHRDGHPEARLCTDNGAMIGAAGARRYAAGVRAGLDLDARPSLPLARPAMPVAR